jgi:hypothetical protein
MGLVWLGTEGEGLHFHALSIVLGVSGLQNQTFRFGGQDHLKVV